MANKYQELIKYLGEYAHDPLGFVRIAFPWGEGGLEGYEGPDEWQSDVLTTIGNELKAGKHLTSAIRYAVSSGNGVGKSSLVAWLILWAMTTYPETRGTVTAGTETQLLTKTWPELTKWYYLFVGQELFQITATALYSRDPKREKNWRIDAVPWSETRPESSAGLHNQGKRLLLVFDEASQIPEIIWNTAEGALTDDNTEIIWCAFGNPTRPDGMFFDCFHGDRRHRWNTKKVDSRTVKISNKGQLQQWLEDYGEDDDRFRVRVRGEFPRNSIDMFFSPELIDDSMNRRIEPARWSQFPPVFGVDVAGGRDKSVIAIRQGDYIHRILSWRGIDEFDFYGHIIETYRKMGNKGIICVDGDGIGSPIVAFLQRQGMPVVDIHGNEKALDPRMYFNRRAELFGTVRDWMYQGGALPQDSDLKKQMKIIESSYTPKGQIKIMPKHEIRKQLEGDSPDELDAIAYTFADSLQATIARDVRSRPVRSVLWY